MEEKLIRLSRTMSYALRHQPEQFGLQLDEAGWVNVEDLLAALRARSKMWSMLDEHDIIAMMEQSEKQRFEMRDGKIRAFYGHSLPKQIIKDAAQPPEFLYHGTTPEAAKAIRSEGLKPMGRQYVHLSADEATARQVALRRTGQPVLFKIATARAIQQGTIFYLGNEMVWLADAISPDSFI